MSTRLDNARVIRAPRGSKISAKSWLTEAPLRMLMNNLDPDVAEKPHELVVYASVSATLILQFAGYVVVLAALVAYGEPLHLEGLLVAIPLWIVMAIGVVGITLFFAALQVFVRDVEHVLMPALMILMYLTPILYPLKLVPESMRAWVSANPFSWLVGRLREALIDGNLGLQWGDAIAVAVAVALYLGGLWIFRRLSPHFEDFV